jgi:archaellum component FlaC
LQDGYKALDNLRKGTEEWKNAVNDLNNSVLDLITQYPELASLVQQDGGILRLDVDSKEVQNVLQ